MLVKSYDMKLNIKVNRGEKIVNLQQNYYYTDDVIVPELYLWILRGNNLYPRIIYPAKLSYNISGKMKIILNSQKLRGQHSPILDKGLQNDTLT